MLLEHVQTSLSLEVNNKEIFIELEETTMASLNKYLHHSSDS